MAQLVEQSLHESKLKGSNPAVADIRWKWPSLPMSNALTYYTEKVLWR